MKYTHRGGILIIDTHIKYLKKVEPNATYSENLGGGLVPVLGRLNGSDS